MIRKEKKIGQITVKVAKKRERERELKWQLFPFLTSLYIPLVLEVELRK
jgi:hypothetical protein